jgi:V/A-type H+-transporting ATPase subunit F
MAGIAIIGDATSVAGFRPLGFATYPVNRAEDACDRWPEVLAGGYAVVFVTEPVYEALAEQVAETADRPLPAVTVIPGVGSAGGVGGDKLERAIERALGTKMPVREEDV